MNISITFKKTSYRLCIGRKGAFFEQSAWLSLIKEYIEDNSIYFAKTIFSFGDTTWD